MRLAILADIHGNLEALEAVLIAAGEAGVDRVISLGDVVGYGADPRGCVFRLQEADALAIMGNHDRAMVEPAEIHRFNAGARQSLLAARETMEEDALAYLRSAAYRRVELGGVLAHAHPMRPEEWAPLCGHANVATCMESVEWDVGFFGHTHHAAIYCRLAEQVFCLTSPTVAIGAHRYLINPGSVGQPRDGDWRAAFALWDVGRHVVELKRVEYAVETAQAKIEAAGFPFYQAERLSHGE